MNYDQEAIEKSKTNQGQLSMELKSQIETKDDLSIAYTPGVAAVCKEIVKESNKWREMTWRGNLVGVVTDGSAVLGLGNIGASAGIPVMEGKAALLKRFAGVDAIPIGLATQDEEEIIKTIKNIKHSFGAINLEDIAAPKCFVIEEALQDIGIPVFHDDQHGTAIVVVAALKKALEKTGKVKGEVKVVINGAGAAGIAICNLLLDFRIENLSVVDSKGVISLQRDDLNKYKRDVAEKTRAKKGSLQDVLIGADVFIGVSKGNILKAEDVNKMNNGIVIAMANPTPELSPEEAKKASIALYGTGRSDLPNQINNALAFPGLFRGLLDVKVDKVDKKVFLEIADELASIPCAELLPSITEESVHKRVAQRVRKFYDSCGC